MTKKTIVTALVFAAAAAGVVGACVSRESETNRQLRRLAENASGGFTIVPIGPVGATNQCEVKAKPVEVLQVARNDSRNASWMILGHCPGKIVRITNFKKGNTPRTPAADNQQTHDIRLDVEPSLTLELSTDDAALGEYTYDIVIIDSTAAPVQPPPPPPPAGAAPTPSTSSTSPSGGGGYSGKLLYCREWPCGI